MVEKTPETQKETLVKKESARTHVITLVEKALLKTPCCGATGECGQLRWMIKRNGSESPGRREHYLISCAMIPHGH